MHICIKQFSLYNPNITYPHSQVCNLTSYHARTLRSTLLVAQYIYAEVGVSPVNQHAGVFCAMHSLYNPGFDLQFGVLKVTLKDEGEWIPMIHWRGSPVDPKVLQSGSFGDPNFIHYRVVELSHWTDCVFSVAIHKGQLLWRGQQQSLLQLRRRRLLSIHCQDQEGKWCCSRDHAWFGLIWSVFALRLGSWERIPQGVFSSRLLAAACTSRVAVFEPWHINDRLNLREVSTVHWKPQLNILLKTAGFHLLEHL